MALFWKAQLATSFEVERLDPAYEGIHCCNTACVGRATNALRVCTMSADMFRPSKLSPRQCINFIEAKHHSALPATMVPLTDIDANQAFENTQTSVAASQMRNALNSLADTVKDAGEKQVSQTITLPEAF